MFGTSIGEIIGIPDFFVQGDYISAQGLTVGAPAFLIFQTVFCATAATIVSGAMAERTKFSTYCLYSLIISAIIYPISGHWIWGGGWLVQLGFHDFAGSTAVHMVSGLSALISAKMLGPRIGKYDKNGKPKAILGHSITLGALGVFILWFCWFGFNGCSTLGMTGDAQILKAGNVFVNTNLAAAVATVAVMCITWLRYKKPDVSMALNDSLAGLVAITAGCDMVAPFSTVLIGLIASFVVVFGIDFFDKKLHIDNPVGAIGVHCLCSAIGTILTGLFATESGLFYTGDASFLGVQVLGVASVALWVTVVMTIVFFIPKKTIGLRVSREVEIAGLDSTEHNLPSAYADFMPMLPATSITGSSEASVQKPAAMPSMDEAVPIQVIPTEPAGTPGTNRITKVTIITR